MDVTIALYISKEYYLENNAMFCIYRTTMNKRKAAEPEPEQGGGDGEGVDVTDDVKPSIHELDVKVNPPPKLMKKSKEHDFTKEVITNLLNNEDDEIDLSLQGVAKRMRKCLSNEQCDDCLMEIIEVVSCHIRASRMPKMPSATHSRASVLMPPVLHHALIPVMRMEDNFEHAEQHRESNGSNTYYNL